MGLKESDLTGANCLTERTIEKKELLGSEDMIDHFLGHT